MNNEFYDITIKLPPSRRKNNHALNRSLKPGKVGFKGLGQEESFTCLHCKLLVTANSSLSGVNNRNHCPVCLHSRHLDHFKPGDRLSSCMTEMAPLALTSKQTHKKYGCAEGELMLVHRCMGCGRLSINRIAADDDVDSLWRVFEGSWELRQPERIALVKAGINWLDLNRRPLVTARLFGRIKEVIG